MPRPRRGRRKRPSRNAVSGQCEPASVSMIARGGRYKPLDEAQLAQIHQAIVTIFDQTGLSEAPPIVIDTVLAAGGKLGDDGRLMFPPALVERALKGLHRSITLHGQRPGHELTLEGEQVYVGTGGAAPFVVDLETGVYRDSTLKDLYDAARMADALEHVQFFSRSLVARDMDDERSLDINTAYASLAGTAKHVMVSASQPEHVRPIAEMCYAIAGSEAAFRARPFLSFNVNHVVPPLRFHAESCQVMAEAVKAGIPVLCNIFGQLGASSPVTIAGSVAQTMVEAIAGMIFAWLIDPEAKAICGPRPMVTDLRTGGMSGGSGEQALATAIATQMAGYYGLPNSTIAGATDSKIPDAQAGYEKALSVTLAAQTGANLITQACGMQGGLMGVSFEAYVIDNDMLGSILRSASQVDVSDATLAVDTIAEVVRGEGHFLGQPETYQRMKSDFLYPAIADRRTPDEWEADGSKDIRQTARDKAREILGTHFPDHIGPEMQAVLRAQFQIKL
ncbi:MAG: trimethylamine methyltransferase [Rhizobiales bacterium]|nr:trimethylamine methyltransferase [Hyphomicrobiales bacterium]